MTTRAGDFLGEAMSQHQQGRLVEADTLYRRCLELEPDNAQALRLCGVLARDQGQLGRSIALLRRAAEAAPGDPRGRNELAISEMTSGDLEAAEASFRRALDSDPESGRVLANLGALLQRRGHLHEAITFHRRYLELEPADLEVICNLAYALMDAGFGELALDEIEKALAIAPDHPLLLANKGAVLCGLEQFEPAAEALERAVAENPGDAMALINLGFARRELQQFDTAADALRRALMAAPDNARAVADLASILISTGQTDEAIANCEHFLERHRGERLTVAAYAFALHEKGRHQEADSILDFAGLIRVIDIDPPPGYDNIADFNKAIAKLVETHPSIVTSPTSKSTTGGDQTGELNLLESEDLSALRDLIEAAVKETAFEWQRGGYSSHPAMAYASDSWALRAWGVVLNEGGVQDPHMHPVGWLSGVYYLRLPPEMLDDRRGAGGLEFGVPPKRMSVASPPDIFPVEPKEGRLLLFPSYFYHRTRPFVSDTPRVSIAFDVVPTS
jgi:tetratricopeptide (TPR) repeat protein